MKEKFWKRKKTKEKKNMQKLNTGYSQMFLQYRIQV